MARCNLLMLLACALAAGCATADWTQDPVSAWPAQDAPAAEWLFTVAQDGDAKATFLISDAVALRDGTLVRLATLTYVGELGLSYGMLLLDGTERFGGGSESKLVFASPRPGLTWGEVSDDEDVVIEFRADIGWPSESSSGPMEDVSP